MVERYRIKPYIQPFERFLAVEELQRLCGSEAQVSEDLPQGHYVVSMRDGSRPVAEKLAYWEAAGSAGEPTPQVLREASASIGRNGVALADIAGLGEAEVAAKIPRKRSLRYGTHGIHEYRGKFFPQLVRALINISGAPAGAKIADPMCGSGTTVVEAVTEGHSGVGFDMNPLSVFVSDVKCRLLSMRAVDLVVAYEQLQAGLAFSNTVSRRRDERDTAYLGQWFAPEVLGELEAVEGAIERVTCGTAQDLYRVALSNVLRSVSYQKEADLRVRREEKNLSAGAAINAFRVEALRSTKSVVAFLAHGRLGRVGEHNIRAGDARTWVTAGGIAPGTVDLVITSPPYATALPYLDTDRLSLIYLGLLPRGQHRDQDKQMIGNREVTERGRRELWADYEANGADLPDEVRRLISRIESENASSNVGFRRRNLPALLGRYFMDMREVLRQTHHALKPGGDAFFVVGNNRTTTPLGEIEIETAQLLAGIAENVGFEASDSLSMEMLASRDLFSKNQTPSEHIIRLRKSEVAEAPR
jgi:site-specific DNA-methyltransferase (cytosine-N4-specific)